MSEMVFALDKKQAGPTARTCRNPEHGKLGAHSSGVVLLCAVCGYQEPASAGDDEDDDAPRLR